MLLYRVLYNVSRQRKDEVYVRKKEKDTHAEIVCAGFGHQQYIGGRCQPVMQTWHSGELISRENPHA